MIGSRTKYKAAVAVTNANAQRIFASRGGGGSGYERISGEIPDLAIKPKFQIARDQKVFTIGSCFARNVESVLVAKGFDCITSKYVFDSEWYEQTGLGARNGALNAYTPAAMRDLLRLGSRADAMTVGALQVGDDEWVDMLASGLKPLSFYEFQTARARLLECYRQIPLAGVVVVTLGYTESWFDDLDQIYVNRSPGGSVRTARRGDRYSFHNLSPREVEDALEDIIRIIRELTGHGAKVLLTASPVPLHATFTGLDSVVANQYSKAALLAAALSAASNHDFVDYLPSYEFVTHSAASVAWEADGVHVKPSLVARVMSKCFDGYLES